MEAQFSDVEFSDILSAFAEVDDMLIGWDVLTTPSRDDETLTQSVDQQLETDTNTSFPVNYDKLADELLTSAAAASMGVGPKPQNLAIPDELPVDMLNALQASSSSNKIISPEELGDRVRYLHPSSSVYQQAEPSRGLQGSIPPQYTLQQPHNLVQHHPQQQVQGKLQLVHIGGQHFAQETSIGSPLLANQVLLQQQQLDHAHILHAPQQQGFLQQQQQSQQEQETLPKQHFLPFEPPLPYLVQTPSSSLTAEQPSVSPARDSMEVSAGGSGGGGSLAAVRSGISGGSAAVATATSNLRNGAGEHDGDRGGCFSTLSISPALQSLQAKPNVSATAAGSGPTGPLSAPMGQWPNGALGTVAWTPVAHLPPVGQTSPMGLNPTTELQAIAGCSQALFAAPAFQAAQQQLMSYSTAAGTGLQEATGLGGPGPGTMAVGSVERASVQPWVLEQQRLLTPGAAAVKMEPVSLPITVPADMALGSAEAAAVAAAATTTVLTASGSAAAVARSLIPTAQSSVAVSPVTATAVAPVIMVTPQLRPVDAPAAATATSRTLGVSGSALLAELVAEAASGAWAAVATGLAPLPSSTGRTAEELLAGLDLQEVFTPPKPSHAKRIRGHVRRAAELKAQLADRVRAIQRLAAENADLRGRAKVLELVVKCRDEQLKLLRNYRTSDDGRLYFVEQLGWGEVPAAAPPGDSAAAMPNIGLNAAALATMPASGLLEMFGRLFADVSRSLAAVDADANVAAPGPGPGSAASSRTATHTHGLPSGQMPEASVPALTVAPAPPPPTSGACSSSGGDGSSWTMAMVTEAPATTSGGGNTGPRGPLVCLRRQMALLRNLLRYLGLVNEEACKLAFTTLTGKTAPPEPGHWLRVVQCLGLTKQQLADAAALHSCWQDWLSRIHSERRNIAAALNQLLSVNRYGATYFESVGQYGTDRDAIHKMHANVMRERILMVLTGEVFCCHILTDLQWARAVVQSYPYILDVRELSRAASQLYYSSIRGLMPCVAQS